MNEQPTALRLANAMFNYFDERGPDVEAVAAELRRQHDRINTVEAALRQAAQQPVAWRWKERINGDFDSWVVTSSEPPPYAVEQQPLYTSPPQRNPLSDEEIDVLILDSDGLPKSHLEFARDIEAAHGIKEKNT